MKFLILILLFSQLLSQDIGQKMIDNGDFDSALNYYKYLLEDEKLSKDDIIFNLATIYSSIDSVKKAEVYFNLGMQDSLNPSSDLSYNRGNMFYKSQMLDESLKFFRDALLKNPEDDDARKNYEFVKNEIKKNQQAQEQNQQQEENSDESENDNNDQKKIKIRKIIIEITNQIILNKIPKKMIITMVHKIRTYHSQINNKIMMINKLKLIRMLKTF